MSIVSDTHPELAFDKADRMRRALRVAEVGVGEMADYLEVSRNTVTAWINGRNEPRRRDLAAFALRTGVPVVWLETGEAPHNGGAPGVPPTGVEPATYGTNVRRFAAVTPIFGERAA